MMHKTSHIIYEAIAIIFIRIHLFLFLFYFYSYSPSVVTFLHTQHLPIIHYHGASRAQNFRGLIRIS
ncbi:hypothetical protein BDZ91DRAFT_8816 [Kalaharituber pfeilii]|nr:hypothetical protein BDZ91DRAFT_8816 [Kalaharituber pfeilii]